MTGKLALCLCSMLFVLTRDDRRGLERHVPGRPKPPHTVSGTLWSRARGALRAAATHLENLTDAVRPIENTRIDRRNTR